MRGNSDLMGEELFFSFWARLHHPGIHLVQVSLEAFLGLFRQAGEFDAHTDSGITGADRGSGGDMLLVDPEIHLQHGCDRQRHGSLNITTVSADVGSVYAHGSVHALIFEFQRKRDLVTLKPSAI